MRELENRLAAAVGAEHVLTDPAVRSAYETDWTGRYRAQARLVVRPGDRDEVAEVLRTCREAGAAVVPQGGNTGLVGGAVPRGGEVVLSLTRLAALGEVDPVAGQVTVGAGAALAAVRAHAAPHGLDVGVDIASRDSATIGGMVATNAGGLRVLRWGSMRAQVAGLEAVLADGRVLRRMSGLDKDSTGYDLVGLLAGSEGTLAVLTEVRLRLVPAHRHRATATLAVAGTTEAAHVIAALRPRLPSLTSAEIYYDDGLRLVCAHADLAPPFAAHHPAYLLAECAADDDPTESLGGALEDLPEVLDSALAVDEPSRRALWAHREGHAEAVNAQGPPVKLDVGVRPGLAADFERDVRAVVAKTAPGAALVLFGHLAEGNFHVNVTGVTDREVEAALTDAVLRCVARFEGTISAEHGVGVAKTRWLELTRSPVERDLMAAVKTAWDPDGILNPGVLLAP